MGIVDHGKRSRKPRLAEVRQTGAASRYDVPLEAVADQLVDDDPGD
jgi:hypothetical protein